MRKHIKLSDIIAGTIATLAVLPYITPHFVSNVQRITLISVSLVILVLSWHFFKGRHWAIKILGYTGLILLGALTSNLFLSMLS